MIAISSCSSNRKTVWYSSTNCQKSVETKRSTYSSVPTVLWSNSHPTSLNCKARLVPPSPAFPMYWLGFDLFSYECRFNLSHADGRESFYRQWGEHFADACAIEWDCFQGGSVLVWGRIIYSVMLTACAALSQHALHKMVDTWDSDVFHWIFSLFLLADTPPNEFKPVLPCNCVLQNKVWLWKLTPMWYHSIFFNEIIIAGTSNFQGMSAKNDSLLQIKEIPVVRIYANSKYLDRNVWWVLFTLAEYRYQHWCFCEE